MAIAEGGPRSGIEAKPDTAPKPQQAREHGVHAKPTIYFRLGETDIPWNEFWSEFRGLFRKKPKNP